MTTFSDLCILFVGQRLGRPATADDVARFRGPFSAENDAHFRALAEMDAEPIACDKGTD